MREQENTAEPFGPAMVTEVSAALDAEGNIVDWKYGVWSNTQYAPGRGRRCFCKTPALPGAPACAPLRPDPDARGRWRSQRNPLYALPNVHVVYHFLKDMPMRVSALRSLGAYLNVFTIESFMDELAEAAGVDPVAFRLRHMNDARARDVIEAAADRFGWSQQPPTNQGHGRGFAFARYKNFGAYCAIVLDLTVEHETGRVQSASGRCGG